MRLQFGECLIDVERRELRRAGESVHVEPQVLDLILYLIQHRDRVVSKDHCWRPYGRGASCRTLPLAHASMRLGRPLVTATSCKTSFKHWLGAGFGSSPRSRRTTPWREWLPPRQARWYQLRGPPQRPNGPRSRCCPLTILVGHPMRPTSQKAWRMPSSPASRTSAG